MTLNNNGWLPRFPQQLVSPNQKLFHASTTLSGDIQVSKETVHRQDPRPSNQNKPTTKLKPKPEKH